MCRCGRLQSRQMDPQSSAAVMMLPSGAGMYRTSEYGEARRTQTFLQDAKNLTNHKTSLLLLAPVHKHCNLQWQTYQAVSCKAR